MVGWLGEATYLRQQGRREGERKGGVVSRTCETRREAAMGFIVWDGATPASGVISAECPGAPGLVMGTGQSR